MMEYQKTNRSIMNREERWKEIRALLICGVFGLVDVLVIAYCVWSKA
jgi:hypothetical protein